MVEPVRHSSLTISSMIGAGKFAHVYSGVLSSVPAGVKKQIHSINDDRDAALVARYVRTEAAVMRECGMHKNVLTLRGWLPHEVSGAIWLVRDGAKLARPNKQLHAGHGSGSKRSVELACVGRPAAGRFSGPCSTRGGAWASARPRKGLDAPRPEGSGAEPAADRVTLAAQVITSCWSVRGRRRSSATSVWRLGPTARATARRSAARTSTWHPSCTLPRPLMASRPMRMTAAFYG